MHCGICEISLFKAIIMDLVTYSLYSESCSFRYYTLYNNVVNSQTSPACTGSHGTILLCRYYRKTSCISRTKFQNLNVSCILMQLSSLNPLKPGVKLRMKM